MKTKSMVLLAMALGCGLVAMLGVQQILSGEQKVKDTVPVLVAKQEIGAGMKLEPSQVAFEDWPRENVPAGRGDRAPRSTKNGPSRCGPIRAT